MLSLSLVGCNYFREFPLYSEVHVETPGSIQLDYYDDPAWWDYPTLSSIRKRVDTYLKANLDVSPNVRDSLRELQIKKGMDKEQVLSVIGEPTKKQFLPDGREEWLYRADVAGTLRWYYRWGKLRFQNGILSDIEVHRAKIYK